MRYFTLAEAGQIMGRSPIAMRGLVRRGRVPYSKLTGRLMIEKTELEQYLKQSRRVSAKQALTRRREAA